MFSTFNNSWKNQPFQKISFAFFLVVITAGCEKVIHQSQFKTSEMNSSFIFSQESVNQHSKDLSSIYGVMAKYYEGVEKSKVNLLDEVFHAKWLMKDTDIPDETLLNVEDKQTFIKRVRDHGPYPNYAFERDIASIDIVYENLAFVRVNKDVSRSSTCFFLFKIENEWTIMDKVWVNPRKEHTEDPVQNSSFGEIEKMVSNYFKAISNKDINLISNLLHEDWDLKYMNNQNELVVESRDEYINNMSSSATGSYIDYSQLLSIDIYHELMAIVRADIPSHGKTHFFTLFKVNGHWKIVNERLSQQSAESM